MRRLVLFIIALSFFVGPVLAAGPTWQYFIHPKPAVSVLPRSTAMDLVGQIGGEAVAAPTVDWEFHPTITLTATSFRNKPGAGQELEILSAAGPALTLQHTTVVNGSNHADYSVNLALLLDGHTTASPAINPAIALTFGVVNNIVNIGVGHDLVQRSDGLGRTFILVGVGINLTNN